MVILGINAYHGDSSACILVDGELLAAAEEERFTRVKHWAGIPRESISFCLREAGVGIDQVQHIALNRDPKANLVRKTLFALASRPALSLVTDRLKNAKRIRDVGGEIARIFLDQNKAEKTPAVPLGKINVHNVEHHVAHLASAYFVSPFDEATAVSVDGFGDFVGAMWGIARGNSIEVRHRTFFPHSLGLFYTALTQYLGFPNYGDEYKVMGLAAYGEPRFVREMNTIVRIPAQNRQLSRPLFELNLDFFTHHSKGVTMTWEDGEPQIGQSFSHELENLLGPARQPGDDIDQRHKDIAASLQARYEEVFFNILNNVYTYTRCANLVLAGGCAMNSLANGRIFERTPFQEVYIQPAAGDAGGAIGAAFFVWNQVLGNPRSYVLDKSYLGPEFSTPEIGIVVERYAAELKEQSCSVEVFGDPMECCAATAMAVSEGKVVGWFQGRMEWGPRALGNRSIVCDPRRADMKDIMNLKIKRRESFRPFAPSIQLEAVGEYFETEYPEPFMLKVYEIRPGKREVIPAVTHVDGTGRLQTVKRVDNPLYWQLIEEFRKITGVPIILNTSFNENEPIVCRPEEALACFLRTKMDMIVLGGYVIRRL